MRHDTEQNRIKVNFRLWLAEVARTSMVDRGPLIDESAAFWRECFDSGMSPYQAYAESFVEQDGI